MAGSTAQIIGILGINMAISTGKAGGPISAIVGCQMVVLTIVSALFTHMVPNLLQIMGLILGILGALILVIPE